MAASPHCGLLLSVVHVSSDRFHVFQESWNASSTSQNSSHPSFRPPSPPGERRILRVRILGTVLHVSIDHTPCQFNLSFYRCCRYVCRSLPYFYSLNFPKFSINFKNRTGFLNSRLERKGRGNQICEKEAEESNGSRDIAVAKL